MLTYDLTSLKLSPSRDCLTSLLIPVCGGTGTLLYMYESHCTTDISQVALLTQAVYAMRIHIITQMRFIPICIVVVRNLEGSFF